MNVVGVFCRVVWVAGIEKFYLSDPDRCGRWSRLGIQGCQCLGRLSILGTSQIFITTQIPQRPNGNQALQVLIPTMVFFHESNY